MSLHRSLCTSPSSLHSSYVLSGYEMSQMLSGETVALSANGHADPASLAKICAGRISSIFEIFPTSPSLFAPSPAPSRFLVWYIEQIIREAPCTPTVPATALSLLLKYQCVLVELDDVGAHTMEEICALFFAAYMAAARAAGEGRLDEYHTFWVRVAGGAHTGPELEWMEHEFMKVVEWESEPEKCDESVEDGVDALVSDEVDVSGNEGIDACADDNNNLRDAEDPHYANDLEDPELNDPTPKYGTELDRESGLVWEEIEIEEYDKIPDVVWEEIEVEDLEERPLQGDSEDASPDYVGHEKFGIWLVASESETEEMEQTEEIPMVDDDDEEVFRNALATPKAKYQPQASASESLRTRVFYNVSKQFNDS